MNTDYMLACGIVWHKMADPDAGSELVEALQSADPRDRALAQALLVDGGESSMRLLERALAEGAVSPEAAGPCMAEIFQNRQLNPVSGRPATRRVLDVSHC